MVALFKPNEHIGIESAYQISIANKLSQGI